MSSQHKAIETAPETIFLCISDDVEHYAEPFPTSAESEVTWACGHPPVECFVAYARADLLTQLRADLDRVTGERDRLSRCVCDLVVCRSCHGDDWDDNERWPKEKRCPTCDKIAELTKPPTGG